MKPLKFITPWMKEFIIEGMVNPAIETICDQLTNFQELDFMALSNFIHKKSKRTFKKLANEVNELHIPDLKLKNLVFQGNGSRQETFQHEVRQDQVTPEPEISTSSHVYQPDIALETEAQNGSPKKKKKKKKKSREKTCEEIGETEAVICDTFSSNEPGTSQKSLTPLTEVFMKLLSYLDQLNSDAKQHIEEEIFSIISSRINSSGSCDTSTKSKKKKKKKSVADDEIIDLINDTVEASPETSKKRKNEDVDEVDIPRKKKKKKKENSNDVNADDASFNNNLSSSGEQRHSLANDEFNPHHQSHPRYISSQTNLVSQSRDSLDFQYELNSMSDTNPERSVICLYHKQDHLAPAAIKVERTSGLENVQENQDHPIDSLPDELAKKSKKKKHSSKKDKSSKRNSSDLQPDPPDQSSTGVEDPPNVEEINPDQTSYVDSGSVPELAEDPRLLEKELLELEQVLVSADKDCQQKKSATPTERKTERKRVVSSGEDGNNPCEMSCFLTDDQTCMKEEVATGFTCYQCREVFDDKSKFVKHWMAHIKNKFTPKKTSLYECDVCKNKFASKKSVKYHIMRVCGQHLFDETLTCRECLTRFASEEELKTHTLVHRRTKSYRCTFCDYCSSHRAADVRNHMIRKHSDIRPYKCVKCNAAFKLSKDLKNHHATVHSDLKPYKCGQCDASFSLKYLLKRHVSDRHSSLKPFACHLCSYSTKRKCNLKVHLSGVHNVLLK